MSKTVEPEVVPMNVDEVAPAAFTAYRQANDNVEEGDKAGSGQQKLSFLEIRPPHLPQKTSAEQTSGSTRRSKKGGKKNGHNLREDQINQIMMHVSRAEPYRSIAKDFQISIGAISYLAKKHKSGRGIIPKPKGGSDPMITEDGDNLIRQCVRDNNTTTLRQIQDSYQRQIGVLLSISTIQRHLDRIGITLKRASRYPEKRNYDEIKDERQAYVKRLVDKEGVEDEYRAFSYMHNCVFIDEAAFNSSMRRNYAWSRAGTPAHVQVPKSRAVSVSLLAAITSSGLVEAAIKVNPDARQKGDKKGKTKAKPKKKSSKKNDDDDDDYEEVENVAKEKFNKNTTG